MTSERRFYQAVFEREVPKRIRYQGELIREPAWSAVNRSGGPRFARRFNLDSIADREFECAAEWVSTDQGPSTLCVPGLETI